MHRSLVALRAVSLVLALAPSALAAQVVVGAVRDQGTRQPVLGAMVRLMADSAWTGVLFLTAADGRFSLEAPGPGRYALRVERIGFASTTAGPVALTAGATVPFDVDVAAEAVRLEGLEVAAGRRRCSLDDDPRGETQALWGEVRKALDAARWTEREAGLQFQVARRTRTLDPSGRHVMDERRRTSWAYGGNSVRTLPPGELAEKGYVRDEDSFIYYYGPDAEVLLSDDFLATHCFGIVGGPDDEPGMVGLEFEPVRGRDVPDVAGVLWVDKATARLERVEFTYARLGRRPGADQARGEVHFAELSDGRWIVRDWSIRAPVLGLSRQFVAGTLVERVRVTGVQEQGSEVLWVRGREVEWRADLPLGGRAVAPAVPGLMSVLALHCAPPGIVVGRVRSDVGEPVAGAVVSAEGVTGRGGVPLSAVTQAEGGFWICAGGGADSLRLVARWGSMASEPRAVALAPTGYVEADLTLALPGARPSAEEAVGDDGPTLVGTVVDATTRARRVEIRLATEAIPLEEMVVTVRGRFPALERSGFYRREQFGQGIMLDRDAVEALAPARTGDILRLQPGVMPGPSSRGDTTRRFFVFRRATTAHDVCLAAVYLDGQMVRQGGPVSNPDAEERMTLDEIVPAQDVEGVEIYETPSALPAQFSGPGAACGVVVIWTRRGFGG